VRIELHCHSTASDGEESPAGIAARAQARGVELFALTDHDSCQGSAAAIVPGAKVVRGVELSCDDGGRTVHILAYDGGGDWAQLLVRLEEVRQARRRRFRVMVTKLEQRGVRINGEALLAAAGERTVGRPDLAKAMVASGAASSFKDAFRRHLYDNGPVDVAQRELSLTEALSLGRAVGARMSLAHPHLYGDRGAELIRQHRDDGLGGVEAFYGSYDPHERNHWIEIARHYNLVCTGGSDFHKIGDAPPGIDLPKAHVRPLLDWLGA
jgi:3',5'-nucleoside bisphosphate phosphatase